MLRIFSQVVSYEIMFVEVHQSETNHQLVTWQNSAGVSAVMQPHLPEELPISPEFVQNPAL